MHVGSDMPRKTVWENVTKESVKNVTQSLVNLEMVANEDKLVATTTLSLQK